MTGQGLVSVWETLFTSSMIDDWFLIAAALSGSTTASTTASGLISQNPWRPDPKASWDVRGRRLHCTDAWARPVRAESHDPGPSEPQDPGGQWDVGAGRGRTDQHHASDRRLGGQAQTGKSLSTVDSRVNNNHLNIKWLLWRLSVYHSLSVCSTELVKWFNILSVCPKDLIQLDLWQRKCDPVVVTMFWLSFSIFVSACFCIGFLESCSI